jgi:hypothetical protein
MAEATEGPSHEIEATIYGYAEKARSDHSNSTYTVYNIVVYNRAANAVSRFSKRYSEFYALHELLRLEDGDVAAFPFPPKKSAFAAGNKNKLAVERKAAFNEYLALLLSKDPLPTAFRDFLGLSLSAFPDTQSPSSPAKAGLGFSAFGLRSPGSGAQKIINIKPKTAEQLKQEAEAAAAAEAASRLRREAEELAAAAQQAANAAASLAHPSSAGKGKKGPEAASPAVPEGPVIVNGREVKSSGRVFSGKPRRKLAGPWERLEKLKVPIAAALGVLVLLVSGLLYMYIRSHPGA